MIGVEFMSFRSFMNSDGQYFQPSYLPAHPMRYPVSEPYGGGYHVGRGNICPTCGQPTLHAAGVQLGGHLGAYGVGVNTGAHLGGGNGLGAHLGGNLGGHNANVGFQFGGR
jgi:hypothetical protein